jgi:hypothetical protein
MGVQTLQRSSFEAPVKRTRTAALAAESDARSSAYSTLRERWTTGIGR